ncbi:MAG TPA: ribonuclease P protein component [Bacillota bacterium]|nr:ribonuclease P protein component [Bacillota bacterium]
MKKEYRIKKNIEIQQLMQKKTTVGNSHFILYYQKNHENKNFRYALSVPKKYGNAVERNLMKRRLREIIKMNHFLSDAEFFIVVKQKANILNFSEIKKLVENLFAQAKILGEQT